jgi:hypothetical protein
MLKRILFFAFGGLSYLIFLATRTLALQLRILSSEFANCNTHGAPYPRSRFQ